MIRRPAWSGHSCLLAFASRLATRATAHPPMKAKDDRQQSSAITVLEPKLEFGLHRSWCNKMGTRKAREEIVERYFVGEIGESDSAVEMVMLPVQDVVETAGDIEQISRRDPRGIDGRDHRFHWGRCEPWLHQKLATRMSATAD